MAEREVKLGAPPSFRLPTLDGLADGVTAEAREPERLATTYLDTDDLRLTRWGVSLRYRGGEGWTVKLPLGEVDGMLVRDERTFEGDPRRTAAGALELVRAFARTAELRPQVRLRTVRGGVVLRDREGRRVADVVDDEVSVLDGKRVAARFRELEVEVDDETPAGLLEAVVERLREAGAGEPDPTPKVVRALGRRASAAPEVVVEDPGACPSAGDVVRRAIAASVLRLISHDPVVRLDVDPEGVHQARVATRRLRSDMRTFGTLLDPEWAASIRAELGWLADALGHVRDGDVLLGRLRSRATRLHASRAADAEPLLAALERSRDEAYADLAQALASERYLVLLDRLVDAARAPALAAAATEPAADVLPQLVRRPWRKLVRSVDRAGDPPTDEELHAIRIRAKRLRYAAEAVAPVLGKPASSLAAAAAGLQEVLGDLHDAVVAEAWLGDWSAYAPSPRAAFAAGELGGLERAAAFEARARVPKAWKRLRRARPRTWL